MAARLPATFADLSTSLQDTDTRSKSHAIRKPLKSPRRKVYRPPPRISNPNNAPKLFAMASTSTLPTPRAFLTDLLSALPAPVAPSSNPVKDLKGADKNLLLTLHVLFPNEFLPALDLLDRGLVTRFRIRSDSAPSSHAASTAHATAGTAGTDAERAVQAPHPDAEAVLENEEENEAATLYYVRSAQPPRSRYAASSAHDPSATHYEVKLAAWNCACPAFAFAAFPLSGPSLDGADGDAGEGGGREGQGWSFGGLSLGGGAPVCKHLLACVLVERCGMFGTFVEERAVSVEEAAGWAAGWGG